MCVLFITFIYLVIIIDPEYLWGFFELEVKGRAYFTLCLVHIY